MEAEVTVREIMTREFVGVSESDTVGDATDLMLEEGTGGVVVLRGSEPVGMLTAADALAAATSGDDPEGIEVDAAMSGTVPSVDPDAPVTAAAGEMADASIGSLLVTDDGGVVGVVSERDVVRAIATLADHASLADPSEPSGRDAATTTVAAGSAETDVPDEAEYSTQSVCESCGSLTHDLRNFNGQLICGNCREV